MKGNLKAPIWIIPVLILVMAIGAFAAVVALNHSTAGTTEASNLDGMELTGVSNIGVTPWLAPPTLPTPKVTD